MDQLSNIRQFINGVLLSGILLLTGLCTRSQPPQLPTGQSLATNMYWYSLQQASSTLFVHFDKTIYTAKENIWFTGYIIKGNFKSSYETMSVALLNNADSTVAAEEKFIMSNGLCFGSMLLPDSLPSGQYSLVAYTNQLVNGTPEDLFIQPVAIKSIKDVGFSISLKLLDSIQPGTDSLHLLLKAISNDGRSLPGNEFTYVVGKNEAILKSGKTVTNAFGEYNFSIPVAALNERNNLLQVKATRGKETENIRFRLPVPDTRPIVKFYPEGGHLVNGVPCVLGFEVTNTSGEAQPATVVLYENNIPLDTVQTDYYGMGHVEFKPNLINKYSFSLLNSNSTEKIALPAILSQGVSLSVKNALAADSLRLRFAALQPGKYNLILHDYHQIFGVYTLNVKQPTITELNLPLYEIPKGLLTITLIDSMERPLSERIVFAHYNKRAFIKIATDSTTYGTKQKVQLSLKLSGDTNFAKHALVSIACVQENRLEAKNVQDIESYFYLKHDLQKLPYRYHPITSEKASADYLQHVLLIKGWRKYTWQDMVNTTPFDTANQYSSLKIKGFVSNKGKPVTSPVVLTAIVDSAIKIIDTDSSGVFTLTRDYLQSKPGKRVMLLINNRDVFLEENKPRTRYKLNITDEYSLLNKKLSEQYTNSLEESRVVVKDARQNVIGGNEKAKVLEAITITPWSDKGKYLISGNPDEDYVCIYGTLNCPAHNGYTPIPGEKYRLRNGKELIYPGDPNANKKSVLFLKGIYSYKEFHELDYSKQTPEEPEYMSTLFWKYGAIVHADSVVNFSFYTSDISGRYRIIVQGLASEGPVYGEQVFTIRKPDE